MTKFSSKDIEAAMSKTKADPNQGFKRGTGGDDDKTICRTEPLGTLKQQNNNKKKKKGSGYSNKFNDDGKLAAKYSIKTNEQEAKLVSTVGPRVKRETEDVELVDVECARCGETFQENPALISTSYYRCNKCCVPNNAQKRKKNRGF